MAISSVSLAQVDDMQVKWGDNLPAKKMLVTDIFSTGESGEFYAINQSVRVLKRETYLEKYVDLKKTEQINITGEYKRGEYLSQYVVELNDQLYAMTAKGNKEARSLTAAGIDNEDLSLSGSEESIYNIRLKKGRRSSYGEYRNTVSRDETRTAYVVEHPGDKTSRSVATVKVFDDNFDLKWKNKITLKSSKELTSIYSITVSNDGTVYMLTKVYKPKNEREKRERNYEFYLLAVTEDGIETEEKLELKDNYIKDLKLNVADNGDLLCGGFYSEEGFRSDGVFFMTLDGADYDVVGESLKKFDMDFITDGMSERAKAKTQKRAKKGKEVGLAHIDFRDIIVKADGGAILVGEYVNIYTTTYTDANGNTRTTTHYNYDDIYVINVSPEGKIDWSERIHKTQHTTNDGGFYSSFFMFVGEEDLSFMFNVREKKDNILIAVSLDSEGKRSERDLVSASKKEKLRIRPKSCEQISDDEFILFAISKKYNKFARVKIK